MQAVTLLCLCLLSAGITRGNELDAEKVFVVEGRDVIFPCSLGYKGNIQSKLFDWRKVAQQGRPQQEVFLYDGGSHYNNGRTGQSEQYKGRVSHFQDQLMNGNASIILRNAKMADRGMYSCGFPRQNKIFYIDLVVELIMKDRSGENPAAIAMPSVAIIYATDDMAQLQCIGRGTSLKPELEWQDSTKNILHAEEPVESEEGGNYDIVLKATVTKTGFYNCVATQPTIGHQISAGTYVHISEKVIQESSTKLTIALFFVGLFWGALILAAVYVLVKKCRNRAAAPPKGYSRPLDATEIWALMQCVVRGSSPYLKVEWQDSDGEVLPAEEPQVSEGERDRRNIIHQTTVTKTGRYHCVITMEDELQINDGVNGPRLRRNGPVEQANGPDDLANVLVDQANGPAAQKNGPAAQANGPAAQANGPTAQKNGPAAQKNGLSAQANGPAAQKNGPAAQKSGPAAQKHVPAAQKNGPAAQKSGPTAQKNGPAAQANGPAAQANGPAAQANGPAAQANGPTAQKNGPAAQANGPAAQANGPTAQKNGPAAQKNGLSAQANGQAAQANGQVFEGVSVGLLSQ